jgi:hypothetical protein
LQWRRDGYCPLRRYHDRSGSRFVSSMFELGDRFLPTGEGQAEPSQSCWVRQYVAVSGSVTSETEVTLTREAQRSPSEDVAIDAGPANT